MIVKIAAAQMTIVPSDLKKNYENIEGICKQAAQYGCNFLCLPEDCWVGPGYIEKYENEVADFVKDKVAHLTKKYHLYCIAGTVIEREEDHPHVHSYSYLFGPQGNIIGRYAKRHLVPNVEKSTISGSVHRVFDTEFGKVGIQICRDILYPEATKVMADMGAKIIFSPSFWSKFSTLYPSTTHDFHVIDELQMIKYLVPARALENEVIMVFTNAAGCYEINNRRDTLLGYTQICQPFTGPIEILRNNKEQLLIHTIDTSVVDLCRKGWKIRGH